MALLLVLGCAVHCDHREAFIENIQRLPVDIQQAIVDCIKQVTFQYCFICSVSVICINSS